MEIAAKIWVTKNFFTAAECLEWIDFTEQQGFEDAPISTGSGKEAIIKDVRNNSRLMIDDEDRAFSLWQHAKELLPKMMSGRVALDLNERLRFYRYDAGQKFRFHYDGSFRRDNGERSLLTFMIYLNDEFEGGETVFMNGDNAIVKPETGMMLAFEHQILHEGSEIKSGRKYVLRSDVMYSK